MDFNLRKGVSRNLANIFASKKHVFTVGDTFLDNNWRERQKDRNQLLTSRLLLTLIYTFYDGDLTRKKKLSRNELHLCKQ